MRKSLLCFAISLFSGSLAGSASAAQVYDQITIDQLQSVLSQSFNVKRDKTNDGNDLLFVQGKENMIGVVLTHCGGTATCEGIEFLAIVKANYTLAQVNQFNQQYSYSKMVLNSEGKARLWLEMYTPGGVTGENINANAAILMVRQDKAEEKAPIAFNNPAVRQVAFNPAKTVVAGTGGSASATRNQAVALKSATARAGIRASSWEIGAIANEIRTTRASRGDR